MRITYLIERNPQSQPQTAQLSQEQRTGTDISPKETYEWAATPGQHVHSTVGATLRCHRKGGSSPGEGVGNWNAATMVQCGRRQSVCKAQTRISTGPSNPPGRLRTGLRETGSPGDDCSSDNMKAAQIPLGGGVEKQNAVCTKYYPVTKGKRS